MHPIAVPIVISPVTAPAAEQAIMVIKEEVSFWLCEVFTGVTSEG